MAAQIIVGLITEGNTDIKFLADPKGVIIEAINISRQEITKRRRRDLHINDIYQIIGSKIDLDKLGLLQSFQDFKNEIRSTFRYLNYLH